jgi:ATP-dependent DNA helicase 2 subunit 1
MIAPRKKESKKKGAALRQEDGELSEMNSHVFATLRAAAELEKRKALYGPNDMVGIILFNTVRRALTIRTRGSLAYFLGDGKRTSRSTGTTVETTYYCTSADSTSQCRRYPKHPFPSQRYYSFRLSADSTNWITLDLNDGNITLEQKFRPWTRRVPLGDVFNACNWLLRDQ